VGNLVGNWLPQTTSVVLPCGLLADGVRATAGALCGGRSGKRCARRHPRRIIRVAPGPYIACTRRFTACAELDGSRSIETVFGDEVPRGLLTIEQKGRGVLGRCRALSRRVMPAA